MERLTDDQTAKERAVTTALVLDGVADAGLVAFALISGSLTMIGEAIRAVTLLGMLVYAFFILRWVHRARLSRYEFGVSKLEQIASVVVGIGLVVASVFIIGKVADTFLAEREAATPFGLALAALMNAANTYLNVFNWIVIRRAQGPTQSEAYRAQLRARRVMMLSSIFLQITLTGAVLAQDPLIALTFDVAGAVFVVCLMLYNGIALLAGALPILLDKAAPPGGEAETLKGVEASAPVPIRSVRTRRDADGAFVEIAVAADATTPPSALIEWREKLAVRLGADGEIRLAIAVEHSRTERAGGATISPAPFSDRRGIA